MNLAIRLMHLFRRTGDNTSLREIIQLRREVLIVESDLPTRASSSQEIAYLLELLFASTGEAVLLEEAVQLGRESLALRPVPHQDRAFSCLTLAGSLTKLFHERLQKPLIEEAILLGREAVALHPQGVADGLSQSSYGSVLATSLASLFQLTRDENLLDEAIELERQSLASRPVEHPDRALSCSQLCLWLVHRSVQAKDSDILIEAIQLGRESLDLRHTNHPERHVSCINLARALTALFDEQGEASLLEEAAAVAKEALKLPFPHYPTRAALFHILGSILRRQFTYRGDYDLLYGAVALHREGLQLCPMQHSGRSTALGTLSQSLIYLFRWTGDPEPLQEAITMEKELLALQPVGHSNRATLCAELAYYLHVLYAQNTDDKFLDQAIEWAQEALSLQPPGNPERAGPCMTLALCLTVRFGKVQTDLLEEAIQFQRQALVALPSNHLDRALACMQLYTNIRVAATMTGNLIANLDEVTDLLDEGLRLCPQGHPNRWRSLIGLAEVAVDRNDTALALQHLNEVVTSPTNTSSSLLNRVVLVLNNIGVGHALDTRIRQLLLDVYAATIDLLAVVAGLALSRSTQLWHVSESGNLSSNAFAVGYIAGVPQFSLQYSDRARGIMWAQALRLRDPLLRRIPSELADPLVTLSGSMNIDAAGYLSFDRAHDPARPMVLKGHDLRHQQNTRLQQLFREIRTLPGLHDFMRGPSYGALESTAAQHPVVLLIVANGSCCALIVRPSKEPLTVVHLEGVNIEVLKELSFSSGGPRMRGDVPDSSDLDRLSMKKSRAVPVSLSILAKIWRAIVKPILMQLGLAVSIRATTRYGSKAELIQQKGDQQRIYWCPTGAFAFLPIHAAGVYTGSDQECILDFAVSSYTPTLAALLRAQQSAHTRTTEQLRLSIISANTMERSNMPILTSVDEEISNVFAVAQKAGVECISNPLARKAEAADAIQSTPIVHVACHGIQHQVDPLQSALCLTDGYLTISEIMDLNLESAFLVFLSACETAKGDKKHSDEIVHLAGSLLFAGFKNIVATMW
jgi:tetratricopeptide (TPR) repeat protein